MSETCITCSGRIYRNEILTHILKHKKRFCSDQCERWGQRYISPEHPRNAPKTPEEIRYKLSRYYKAYDEPYQTKRATLKSKWQEERQHRLYWVKTVDELTSEHKRKRDEALEDFQEEEQRRKEEYLYSENKSKRFKPGVFTFPELKVPEYEPSIEYPYSIWPDPTIHEWELKIAELKHPKCEMGYIHPEHLRDAPCEAAHPNHLVYTHLIRVPEDPRPTSSRFTVTAAMSDFV